jgi:L-arabinose isomerase
MSQCDALRSRPRVALLPLYLSLYDSTLPGLLPKQEQFLRRVSSLVESQGIEVILLPVCRLRQQVEAAIASAEQASVDGIATLHLAYSPSLEAGPPLCRTSLPLLLLDTTPGSRFGATATMDDVLENHGIHGVQDLTSLLRREGRRYTIAAGPLDDQGLSTKLSAWARAAQARSLLGQLVVARIGDPFPGMGDFAVSEQWLRRVVGPAVACIDLARIGALAAQVTPTELAAERQEDEAAFDLSGCSGECWERSARMGLALRRALGEVGAGAFSMNFASFDRGLGSLTVPFLEASKAMARGLGYAGEGDLLTASLVAALNRCYGPTTFTEMFCPDWSADRVFMSHMGECNPALARERPHLAEKDYAFGPVDNPAVLLFALRPGPAALVNLAPTGGDVATLIAAPVSIEDMRPAPGLPGIPHFWIAPRPLPLADFLERYSQAGGTHHLALTPGLPPADLRLLAQVMGWEFVLIQ